MRSDNLSRNDKDAKNYIQTVILFHKYLVIFLTLLKIHT